MSSRARTLVIFFVGIVLAFVWGIYYVILSVAGFDIELTLEFLVPTLVAIAGLGAVEWYVGRRHRSSEEAHA